MSVEFNEENDDFTARINRQGASQNAQWNNAGQQGYGAANTRGMAGWLIKKGIVKNESAANAVLLSVAFISFLLSIFIIFKFVL